MLPQSIVYISIFTSVFAGFFYIRDTWQGKTKPNLVSWVIWFIAPFIAALISLDKGAGLASLPIFMATFTPFVVVVLACVKKNVYWKLKTLDYVCFILSLLAIVTWIFLKEGTWATIFAILADLIAFVPTYIKSWKAPDTETVGPYFSGMFNPFLSIATLGNFSFVTTGFALYLFLGNLIEIVIVLIRRKNKK